MQDLIGAPADEVATERARVATEGWGAQLLAMQEKDGAGAKEAWNHGWNSTMHASMGRWQQAARTLDKRGWIRPRKTLPCQVWQVLRGPALDYSALRNCLSRRKILMNIDQ